MNSFAHAATPPVATPGRCAASVTSRLVAELRMGEALNAEFLDPANYTFNPPTHAPTRSGTVRDIFAEAQEKFTIYCLWPCFGFGDPPRGMTKSPFREESRPSFSIYDGGKKWKDHGTGECGDVVEFVRFALGLVDHSSVRAWLSDKLGVHSDPPPMAARAMQRVPVPKQIEWPAELEEGTVEMWDEFATLRGLTYSAAWVLVKAGFLRFCTIAGQRCYVVTDNARRSAEVRLLDGTHFGRSKQFPLRGVDKSWLPGAEMLTDACTDTAILLVEGATDLLSATDLYVRYRKFMGGTNPWRPLAVLGAGCKTLDASCADLIRGRYVRLVPDADRAGDQMRDHWERLFLELGCEVDVVCLPPATDLTDHLHTVCPLQLFSK